MKISENVYMLESSKQSHVFFINANENILIDTGLPGNDKKIILELKSLGVSPCSISRILLTHHDIDHIGNAKKLQEITDAQLWAPEKDVPYITGELERPGIKRIIGKAMGSKKPTVFGQYSKDQHFGEIKAVHAPGHTPGHTIFIYRNIVFSGDLCKISNNRLKLLPNFYHNNPNELKKSLSLLKDIDYEWLCPSHGSPIRYNKAVKDFLMQY